MLVRGLQPGCSNLKAPLVSCLLPRPCGCWQGSSSVTARLTSFQLLARGHPQFLATLSVSPKSQFASSKCAYKARRHEQSHPARWKSHLVPPNHGSELLLYSSLRSESPGPAYPPRQGMMQGLNTRKRGPQGAILELSCHIRVASFSFRQRRTFRKSTTPSGYHPIKKKKKELFTICLWLDKCSSVRNVPHGPEFSHSVVLWCLA